MKILVTGAKGMLGTDLLAAFSAKHDVIGVDIDGFDVTDNVVTGKNIARINPDIVVHAAAFTNVDGCETNVALAYKVNAVGTQNIALGCQALDIPMLYISTDFVFDGKKGERYLEWDMPNPLAVYGASKYAGEQIVRALLNKFYVVRIAWLYGEHGNNFVKTILRLADEKDRLQIVSDQVGSPTYTKDAARGILKLLATQNYGTYHMVNKGEVSWFGFASKILELAGRNDIVVEPITTQALNRPAKRPGFSALRNMALELTIGDFMRPWDAALEEFMIKR
ncbi:MAG TPA: dTDP-4-dehydrorhamnose reductase [Candidatus Aquicultor sp.]